MPARISQRRFQLSIADVFIFILTLSPAFLSIRHVVDLATNRTRGFEAGTELFAIVYAFVSTFVAFRRRALTARNNVIGVLLGCVACGALFGVLYFALLFGPVVIAEQIFAARANGLSVFSIGTLIFGLCLGAPAGCAVWILIRAFPGLEGKSRNTNLAGAPATQSSINPNPAKFSELDMETLFSTTAHEAMKLAESEARKNNHEYIGTEHLLFGLLSCEVLAAVLRSLNVPVEVVQNEIKLVWPTNPDQLSPVRRELAVPFTPAVKRAFDRAYDEAQPLKEGGRRIDASDLLIGLLREQDGVAAQILMNHGISLDALRSEIKRIDRPT